jgi:hypothetical protein
MTGSLIPLSVLGSGCFEFALAGISAGDPNTARIIDVLSLPSSSIPVVLGQVPLSPSSPDFAHRHLWRRPVMTGNLTTLLCSTTVITSDNELRLVLRFRYIIQSDLLGFP